MLEVLNLHFDYHDTPLLHNINLTIAPGQIIHVCGANGAGKTTFLKLLAGLLHPWQGEIRYEGQNIHTEVAAYQHNLCYIGHKNAISAQLTVAENCRFFLDYLQDNRPLRKLAAESNLRGDSARRTGVYTSVHNDLSASLTAWGLSHLADVSCALLSTGQKRRVSLLRLLLTQAPLWLLDEPYVALDAAASAQLSNLILRKQEKGGMVLITSHQALPPLLADHREFWL